MKTIFFPSSHGAQCSAVAIAASASYHKAVQSGNVNLLFDPSNRQVQVHSIA